MEDSKRDLHLECDWVGVSSCTFRMLCLSILQGGWSDSKCGCKSGLYRTLFKVSWKVRCFTNESVVIWAFFVPKITSYFKILVSRLFSWSLLGTSSLEHSSWKVHCPLPQKLMTCGETFSCTRGAPIKSGLSRGLLQNNHLLNMWLLSPPKSVCFASLGFMY